MNRPRPAALALLFSLAALLPGHAASQLTDLVFSPGSGIQMRATSAYEEIPPAGFLPVRLEVRNRSAAAHTWQIRSTHTLGDRRIMQSATSVTVDAQSERVFELLLPLAIQAGSYGRYSNLELAVSGHGVVEGLASQHSSTGGRTPTSFLGMGEALSVKNWGPLRERLDKKHSRTLDGTSLDIDFLPEDWRGLAGFGVIILTDQEWRQVPPGPRGALQDWVLQGGSLILCHEGFSAPADLPAAGGFGCGSISHWKLGDDFIDLIVPATDPVRSSLANDASSGYGWSWPLALLVGQPAPPRVPIIVFVIVFAVVIGPLNFAVFAPSGNRHRLFWTTPSISLVATVLMGIFIVLSEGFGGRGERFEVQLSMPSQRKTVLWQEQMSRTGVLLGSAFTASEPALILPISLRQENDSPYSYRRPGSHTSSWFLSGTTWSGDWFRTRTAQAQAVVAAIPSRAELAISSTEGGAPIAISSFEQELRDLWYFDERGSVWRTEAVRPGEKKHFAPAEERDFQKWLQVSLEPAGALTKDRTRAFARDRKGKFFASAAPKSIATLDAIRWNNAGALIFGETAR